MRQSTGILAAVVVLVLTAQPDARTPKRVCREACATVIEECVARGLRPRLCRKAYLRKCRRRGIDLCESASPPSETTTTIPMDAPTTTSVPPSTVTTTVTSTTAPGQVSPTLRIRLLAWARYLPPVGSQCEAYDACSSNSPPPRSPAGFKTDGIAPAVPPFPALPYWNDTNGISRDNCTGRGQVIPTDQMRADFFDQIFPTVTLDPASGLPCAPDLSVSRERCAAVHAIHGTEWYYGRRQLLFDTGRCSAYARYGCATSDFDCLPFPIEDGQAGCRY
jgi:hypothetical protein